MKKRIVIFSTAYFPFIGGAEVAVKEITDRLPEYACDIITARLKHSLPEKEQIGAVTVYRVGIGVPLIDKLWLALWGARFAARLHQKEPYNYIWSIMASYNGFAASMFKRLTGLPFLLTLQEGDPFEYIEQRVRWVKRAFANIFMRADALQAISRYLLTWGKQKGFRGKIAEVVPNGVAVEHFGKRLSPDRLSYVRQEFGFDTGAVVLITVSRLVLKNGVGDCVKALALLPSHVCLVVCGSGELEGELKALARELGVEKRVRWLGSVGHDRLPEMLQAADIFIRPSLSEGLGNAFLEAMVAGCVTVGTPVGGIPDFLTDGITGFMCEPANPESAAEVITHICSLPPETRQAVVDRAQKLVREAYTWDLVAHRLARIFEAL